MNSLMSYNGSNLPARHLPDRRYADGYARVYASVADFRAGKVKRFKKMDGNFVNDGMTAHYDHFDPMI